jgi:fermentation-respiration switch protein FrsA (DUF1100 family)
VRSGACRDRIRRSAEPRARIGPAALRGGRDRRRVQRHEPECGRLRGSAASRGILAGLVAARRIAVSGQSDGGSTALAAADNIHYADHRIRAVMILSGAEIPGLGGYDFPPPSPPLLAVQGTGDTVNAPRSTYRLFSAAPAPQFLLQLWGAPHLGPYTTEQPQLGIVERVTLAFLDRYLEHMPGARWRLWAAGDVPGRARLSP